MAEQALKSSVQMGERLPFMAFVLDDATRAALVRVAEEQGWSDGEVLEGGVREAVDALAGVSTPQVLVIDLSNSNDPLDDSGSLAGVCDTGTRVIALGNINDAAAGADYGDQPADPGLLGPRHGGLLGHPDEERVQGFRRHRLEQIVMDAQGGKAAEQVDVVDIPQGDDARARVADLRQRADVVKGIVGIGEIDHQHLGRENAGKGVNGLVHATLQHLVVGPALILGDADKGGARGIVKDKGHEREAFAHSCG